MIYIASPYSHPDPAVREQRYEDVREYCALRITDGICVFSPIVYAHEMAKAHTMPTDAKTWERFNTTILRRCSQMIVLELSGWEESKGVRQEIIFANQLLIPVTHVRFRREDY